MSICVIPHFFLFLLVFKKNLSIGIKALVCTLFFHFFEVNICEWNLLGYLIIMCSNL